MATEGGINAFFECDIILDKEIYDNHTVNITGSGLELSQGGIISTELTYGFTPLNYNVAQKVGIKGPTAGRFDLVCKSSATYYQSFGELRKKESKVRITIIDADGWFGSKSGCARNPGLVGGDADFAAGDLYYKFTNLVVDAQLIELTKTSGWAGSTSSLYKIYKPNGTIVYASSVVLDQLGVYQCYPIEVFLIDSGGTGSIGTSTFRAIVRSGSPSTKTTTSSGLIYKSNIPIVIKPINEVFSQQFGDVVDNNAPSGITIVGAIYSGLGAGGHIGGITPGSMTEYTFSGYRDNYVGSAINVLFNDTSNKYIAVGGIYMGNGSSSFSSSS